MEGRDTLFDDGDDLDVTIPDVEEGELIDLISKTGLRESFDVAGANRVNQESRNPGNSKTGLGETSDVVGNQESCQWRSTKKRNSQRKRINPTYPKLIDVSRFVEDVCKQLKERKHYLMWTAVGCLGISALRGLVKEVDAIQSCGGQKAADGKHFRKGGVILWNIIKARDPNAYKEIMTRGREFVKQFKHPLQALDKLSPYDGLELVSNDRSGLEKMRGDVHDRLRLPVSYDDLFGGGECIGLTCW